MPLRVLLYVVLIVIYERKLYLRVARAIERHLIERITIWIQRFQIFDTDGVLVPSGLEREQPAHLRFGDWIAIPSVGFHDIRPERPQPFCIGVAVLRDDGLDALGVIEE